MRRGDSRADAWSTGPCSGRGKAGAGVPAPRKLPGLPGRTGLLRGRSRAGAPRERVLGPPRTGTHRPALTTCQPEGREDSPGWSDYSSAYQRHLVPPGVEGGEPGRPGAGEGVGASEDRGQEGIKRRGPGGGEEGVWGPRGSGNAGELEALPLYRMLLTFPGGF